MRFLFLIQFFALISVLPAQHTISPMVAGQFGFNSVGAGLGVAVRIEKHEAAVFHNMNDQTLSGLGMYYRYFPFHSKARLQGFLGTFNTYQRLPDWVNDFPDSYDGDFFNIGLGIGAELGVSENMKLWFTTGPNWVFVRVPERPGLDGRLGNYLFAALGLKYDITWKESLRESVHGPEGPTRSLFFSYHLLNRPDRLGSNDPGGRFSHLAGIIWAPWPKLRVQCKAQLGTLPASQGGSEKFGLRGIRGGLQYIHFHPGNWYNYVQANYLFGIGMQSQFQYGVHLGKEILNRLSFELGGDLNHGPGEWFSWQAGLVWKAFRL